MDYIVPLYYCLSLSTSYKEKTMLVWWPMVTMMKLRMTPVLIFTLIDLCVYMYIFQSQWRQLGKIERVSILNNKFLNNDFKSFYIIWRSIQKYTIIYLHVKQSKSTNRIYCIIYIKKSRNKTYLFLWIFIFITWFFSLLYAFIFVHFSLLYTVLYTYIKIKIAHYQYLSLKQLGDKVKI